MLSNDDSEKVVVDAKPSKNSVKVFKRYLMKFSKIR